ncbi:hypothetical protein TMEN_6881 [Trichophyton mentagrophytes]|nr:hypothetical protein TMEN_6881 [Trichophyton mentagrophytes]
MDNDLMTYLPELQEALQDVYSEMGYTEMWGVDLAKGDKKEPRRSNNFEIAHQSIRSTGISHREDMYFYQGCSILEKNGANHTLFLSVKCPSYQVLRI